MKTCLCIAATWCMLAAGQVRAGFQGIVTIKGLATGSLGGQAFTDALVTFSGTYDTDNIRTSINPLNGSFTAVVPVVESLTVADFGVIDLGSGGTAQSFSRNREMIFPPSTLSLPGVMGGFVPFNADYDFSFSFGPVGLAFSPPPPPIESFPTQGGQFTITSIRPGWTGEVTVATPAPPGFLLAWIGALCLLMRRLRRVVPPFTRRQNPALSGSLTGRAV